MSKAYAMAGLRIGWIATRDRALLDRAARFKDYTTLCPPAPSELSRSLRSGLGTGYWHGRGRSSRATSSRWTRSSSGRPER